MEQQRVGDGKGPVPLYAKIGWVVAWVVMLGLLTMILRNCATSIIYGLKSEQVQVDSYYRTGLEDGRAGHHQSALGQEENSVLRKAYVKGYRDGIDKGRQ